MRLIYYKNVKLNKKVITSTFLSNDAILAYTGLCIARSQLDKQYCLCISIEDIAHYLGFKKIKWYTLYRINKGLKNLQENNIITVDESKNKKSIRHHYKKKLFPRLENYYLYQKELYAESYIDIPISSINILMYSNEKVKECIPLLRYFIVLIGAGGYYASDRERLTHQYAGILSPEICHRYNQFLENIGIIQKNDSSDM